MTTHSTVTWLIRSPEGQISTLSTSNPNVGPKAHMKPDLTDYPASAYPPGSQIVGSFAHLIGSFHTQDDNDAWDERYPVFHLIPVLDGEQCWRNWKIDEIRTTHRAKQWLKRMRDKHDHGFQGRRSFIHDELMGAWRLYAHGFYVATGNPRDAGAWLEHGRLPKPPAPFKAYGS